MIFISNSAQKRIQNIKSKDKKDLTSMNFKSAHFSHLKQTKADSFVKCSKKNNNVHFTGSSFFKISKTIEEQSKTLINLLTSKPVNKEEIVNYLKEIKPLVSLTQASNMENMTIAIKAIKKIKKIAIKNKEHSEQALNILIPLLSQHTLCGNFVTKLSEHESILVEKAVKATRKIAIKNKEHCDTVLNAILPVCNLMNDNVATEAIHSIKKIALIHTEHTPLVLNNLKILTERRTSNTSINAITDLSIHSKQYSKEALNILKDIACDSKASFSQAATNGIIAIGRVGVENKEITEDCLNVLNDTIKIRSLKKNLASAKAVGMIGAKSEEYCEKALKILEPNLHVYNLERKKETIKAIGMIGAKSKDDKIVEKVKTLIEPYLNDKELNIKKAALIENIKIKGSIFAKNKNATKQDFEKIKGFLGYNSSKIVGSALISIGKIGATNEKFSEESFNIISKFLHNPNEAIQISAIDAMKKFASKNLNYSDKILRTLEPFTKIYNLKPEDLNELYNKKYDSSYTHTCCITPKLLSHANKTYAEILYKQIDHGFYREKTTNIMV